MYERFHRNLKVHLDAAVRAYTIGVKTGCNGIVFIKQVVNTAEELEVAE